LLQAGNLLKYKEELALLLKDAKSKRTQLLLLLLLMIFERTRLIWFRIGTTGVLL
jgi:hypothetical protein